MSDQQKAVTVNILDKEYTVACTDAEREDLHSSAGFLNEKIKEVRSSGNVVGSERIVVMAALNIVHEHLQYKQNNDGMSENVQDVLNRVQAKISNVLDDGGNEEVDLKQA
jgi:cell division protein ZapA